ncbi:hypothetical protein SGLAM104S_04090 [Streptomyces glaucescens]
MENAALFGEQFRRYASEGDGQMSRILATGATGLQGGAVARELVRRGQPVAALVRDPASQRARALADLGVELVRGDLDDESSLRSALEGPTACSRAELHDPGRAGWRGPPGPGARAAAKAVGTGHVVYTSVGGAERESGVPHFDSKRGIERYLEGTGGPLTVLRPTFFMDDFAAHGPERVDGTLVVRLALKPDTRVQFIAVDDIGWFAAEAFDRPEAYVGRAVEIAGDALTATQIAEAFSARSGLPARSRSCR